MNVLHNPHLRLFVGAVLISFSPVFVKLVSVAPTTSAFYRVLVGGLVLTGFLIVTRRRLFFTRIAWCSLVVAAVFFALDLWFWHRSIVYIGPGLATLLANLQVFFMIAAGMIVLGQRPSSLQFIAAPMAIGGLAMIVGTDWGGLTQSYRVGVVFGVLTAVSYAGYMLSMRRARLESRYAVPVPEVAIMSLIAAALLGSAAILEGESLAIPTALDAGWLLSYGLLAQVVGLLFIASSLDKVTTTETGIALLLQPSLSFIWDIAFFGRSLSLLEALGAIVTLSAIFLGSMRRSIAARHGDSQPGRIQ